MSDETNTGENNLSVVKTEESNNLPAVVKVVEEDGKFIIPRADLNSIIVIDGIEYAIVPAQQLYDAVGTIETLTEERDLLEYGVLQICGVLGLTNEARTEVKPEVVSGEEGVFKNLMKSGADLFLLFSKTSMPGSIGRNAEAKVKENFSFIDKVLPILKKRSK